MASKLLRATLIHVSSHTRIAQQGQTLDRQTTNAPGEAQSITHRSNRSSIDQLLANAVVSRRRILYMAVRIAFQFVLLLIIFQTYSYFRKTYFQQPAEHAFANAVDVIDLQAVLGFPVERLELRLQCAVIGHGWLVDVFNTYYHQMKFVVYVSAVLAMVVDPVRYRMVRRVFLLSTLIAFPWYALYPLAPPRLMQDRGYQFVDTLALFGGTVSSSSGPSGANQFAAMPSMHIGWSIIAALWLTVALPKWKIGAIIGIVHVLMMSVTVMATGNHYALDVVAGFAVVGFALLLDRLLPGEAIRFGRSRTGIQRTSQD